jgi:hypothetical protein
MGDVVESPGSCLSLGHLSGPASSLTRIESKLKHLNSMIRQVGRPTCASIKHKLQRYKSKNRDNTARATEFLLTKKSELWFLRSSRLARMASDSPSDVVIKTVFLVPYR